MTSGNSSHRSSKQRSLRYLLERERWEDALLLLQTRPSSARDEIEAEAEQQRSSSSLPGSGAASRGGSSSSSSSSSPSFSLLHLACEKDAPDEVILAVLELDEGAASRRGRGGNLPLHIAARRQLGADVIEGLIRANPATLDFPNYSNVIPRNLAHPDPCSHQALCRPSACWHQLMSDEDREEAQDARLAELHSSVDAALTKLQSSNDRYDGLSEKVELLAGRLEAIEKYRPKEEGRDGYDGKSADPVTELEVRLRHGAESVEARLSSAEVSARSAVAREFMARAASMARRSDVARMQKRASERAEKLRRDLEGLRGNLEFRSKMGALGRGREQGSSDEKGGEHQDFARQGFSPRHGLTGRVASPRQEFPQSIAVTQK